MADQNILQQEVIHLVKFLIIQSSKVFIEGIIPCIFIVIIQKFPAYFTPVILLKGFGIGYQLEAAHISYAHFRLHRVASADIQQKTGIVNIVSHTLTCRLFFLHQFLQIIIHGGHITAMLGVFKEDLRIRNVKIDICHSVPAGIALLLLQRSMTHHHIAHFGIVAVQTVGKHHRREVPGLLLIPHFGDKLLVENGIIFVDPLFCQAFMGKRLHGLPVSQVGLHILRLVPDDTGIDKGFALTAQGILIGKIQTHRPGKRFLIMTAHGFYVKFVQTGDADIQIHRPRVPFKIFFLPRLSQHHQPADGLHHIFPRTHLVGFTENPVHTGTEGLFMGGQMGDAHSQFFRHHLMAAGEGQHLNHKGRQLTKLTDILLQYPAGHKIENGTGDSHFKLLFQKIHLLHRGMADFLIAKKHIEDHQTSGISPVQRADPFPVFHRILLTQSRLSGQIQIGGFLLTLRRLKGSVRQLCDQLLRLGPLAGFQADPRFIQLHHGVIAA